MSDLRIIAFAIIALFTLAVLVVTLANWRLKVTEDADSVKRRLDRLEHNDMVHAGRAAAPWQPKPKTTKSI